MYLLLPLFYAALLHSFAAVSEQLLAAGFWPETFHPRAEGEAKVCHLVMQNNICLMHVLVKLTSYHVQVDQPSLKNIMTVYQYLCILGPRTLYKSLLGHSNIPDG